MKEKPKVCPFCGEQPVVTRRGNTKFIIGCTPCNMQFNENFKTATRSIKWWNRRVQTPIEGCICCDGWTGDELVSLAGLTGESREDQIGDEELIDQLSCRLFRFLERERDSERS